MNMMKTLSTTEQANRASYKIDTKSSLEICKIINDEDKKIPFAVEKSLKDVAALIDDVVLAFNAGGRLIYIGAGTSGRLGVLDASECPPTYGVSPSMVQGIIAGGERALTRSVEAAEDDGNAGIEALKKIGFSGKDVLVGITASGEAAFVMDAMQYASELGSSVGAISCNEDSRVFAYARHKIYLSVGPEIVTGSTRMKAGTAQKLVLNMITTASMIRIGKVYNNYMVDLRPTNKKLIRRSKRLIAEIAQCSEEDAERAYAQCHNNIRAGILIAMFNISYEEAILLLESSSGNLHRAIDLYHRTTTNTDSEIRKRYPQKG
ncbi:MAG: N-acetylmuramic acid 6-phosphate etherase [Sphaerochaetaceae bacterium]|nr:N-acetylmuramic acid 6-phosphate etherase [Sphaerochaetaceae bacterium]